MTNPPDLTARVDALIYHMSECHTLDNHDQQTVIDMRDTIRALSADRDALKAELARAKITLLAIAKGDVPSSRRLPQWHDKYQDLRGEARAFLARHQKGQTND